MPSCCVVMLASRTLRNGALKPKAVPIMSPLRLWSCMQHKRPVYVLEVCHQQTPRSRQFVGHFVHGSKCKCNCYSPYPTSHCNGYGPPEFGPDASTAIRGTNVVPPRALAALQFVQVRRHSDDSREVAPYSPASFATYMARCFQLQLGTTTNRSVQDMPTMVLMAATCTT